MTSPTDEPGERPGVYARLHGEAEASVATRVPPRAARWWGWAITLALAGAVVLAALRANPW